MIRLTKDNFFRYALANYHNTTCKTLTEFEEEYNRFMLIKKLLNREDNSGVHLTLNHIITMYNVFERSACTAMLFFKTPEDMWYKLKTFLVFLNLMPDTIPELNIQCDDIKLCSKIIEELRKI